MADEDRNFGVRENLIRHAAQDDRGNAAAAVRRHDDEIASSLLGGLDNRLMGMILQDLRGFALDPRRARRFRHRAQYLAGMRFGVLGIFGEGSCHLVVPG